MYRSVHTLLFVTLVGCAGESTSPPPPPSAPEAPVAKIEPPPKPIDLHFGDGYQMLHPVHDGRLTVIPIVANTAPASPTKYITLEAGMARHLVTVRELGEWQVDTVRIKNKSREPVLAMSGELVIDALQDRVIARDTIIAPHSSANVAVRCVEQNRERGGRTFHPGNALAELDLRQVVVQQGQPQVWALVDQINARLGLTPGSKTYRLAAQHQPADRASSLVQQLASLPERDRMVGLAVAIDGQVIAIDRFASPELYQQLEGELLGSYVASDGGPPHEGKHALAPDDVRSLAASPTATTTDASFVVLAPISAGPCQRPDAYAVGMKLLPLVVVAMTGCSAATSAVGSLLKPKPPEITINNHVEVAAQAPAKPSASQAMVGGGMAGAVAGGLTAALLKTTPETIAEGALVGAGIGTAVGYVVHTALD